jgi:hypothetical protein
MQKKTEVVEKKKSRRNTNTLLTQSSGRNAHEQPNRRKKTDVWLCPRDVPICKAVAYRNLLLVILTEPVPEMIDADEDDREGQVRDNVVGDATAFSLQFRKLSRQRHANRRPFFACCDSRDTLCTDRPQKR